MPASSLSDLGLEGKNTGELQVIYQDLVADLRSRFNNDFNHPDLPLDQLNKMAVIAGALRTKNAGPPKTPKKGKKEPAVKASLDDLAL